MGAVQVQRFALTNMERTELTILERTIEKGIKTFVSVGSALQVIRDGRLYRAEYGTFEEYCETRWGMQRAYAHRLVAASGVVQNLSPIGDTPTSESQVRPLTRLEPEDQREAWGRANEIAEEEGTPVRARHVEKAVQERTSNRKRIRHDDEPTPETVLAEHIKWWEKELLTLTDVIPETAAIAPKKALAALWTKTIEPMLTELQKLNPQARSTR